jgi:ATP-binding cassette subfamily F protein 3
MTVYEGAFDRFVSQKALRRDELLARKATQDRQIAETEKFIDRFRAKASKAKQVQSRIKALNRLVRVEVGEEARSKMRLKIPPVARSGDVSLRLEGIKKAYGDTVVYEGVDLLLRRKDRVALVGPNGAGKSTLLRIAAGELPFEGGERTVGHNVKIAFFAQHQLEVLDPRRTVLEELETAAQTEDVPRLRGQLGAFLFSGDDVDKKVAVLSGGEKSRLALAKLLLRPANFLVLDEPTNHLDLISREVLEQGLAGYDGTLLLISHDRTFLNALVDRVIEVDGGALAEYTGNYDAYLRRSSQLSPAAQTEVLAEKKVAPSKKNAKASAAKMTQAPAVPKDTGPPLSKSERIAARQLAKERSRRQERNVKKLGKIEEEIRGHEENLEALGWKLGDPNLHRDPEAARSLEADRVEMNRVVAELYEQWERLSAEVEAGEQVAG